MSASSVPFQGNADLLARAASCYARAGWNREACRCFEQTGQHAEAARLYEIMELWPPAAEAYVLAGAWSSAARCYLRAGEPAPAAEYLLKAGEPLEAGWVLAEHLHRFQRARAVVDDAATPHVSDEAARELVLARCEAGSRQPGPAAKRLRRVIAGFGELGPGFGRQRIEDRVVAVASTLGRPDLAARLYAAVNAAQVPGAVERWEAWALETLGDATGIPMNEGDEDGER